MKRLLSFSLLFILVSLSWALPTHKFTQYASEDGLDENVVQNILQDHNGLMWFAT